MVERLRERLHLIPRYRMRLDEVLRGAGYPVWAEVPGHDPDRHVRRAALPPPGGDAELCELVGETMSERLDRSRPLWQITVVEGLAGGRTALVAKMHHALVDGMAAVDVSTVILDPTPEGLELPPPPVEPEGRRAYRVEQLAGLAATQLDLPRRLAREAVSRAFTLDPQDAARQIRGAAGVVGELARIRPQAPRSRLNAEIGRERLFAVARARLDEVKAIRRATGATVNDVLLAAVALMLSEYLGDGRAGERRGARARVGAHGVGARRARQPDLDRVRGPAAAGRAARPPERDLARDGRGQALGPGARRRADRGRHRPGAAARLLACRPGDERAAHVQPGGLERARPAADLLPGRRAAARGLPRPCRSTRATRRCRSGS